MTPDERNRVIVRSVVTFLGGVVLLLTLFQLREVLMTLYISSLLAIGLSPIVRRLEHERLLAGRIRVPRWAAILALYVTFLAAVALIAALILPPLVRQIQQLVLDLPSYVDRLQAELVKRKMLDHTWSWSSMLSKLQTPAGIALSGLFGAVTGFVGIMAKVITILLLPFYLLLEAKSLQNGMLSLVHPDSRARAARIARHVTEKVGAWLGGQFVLAAVIGSTATVGYWLIGVPYFYVLGLLAAVGELIPVVGPILAAVPAILLGATVSPQTAFITTGFCWAQQFVENNFLVPRIMGRQVGISPVTIMVALLTGTSLFGFVGAILAVPTAAIAQVLVQEFLTHDE
ncbi:MAG TPA: AI-2E family transporter [Vicinamibacterales bacterium]|nr:AI-2E family transporter [Vicinamibacterales bacterium]